MFCGKFWNCNILTAAGARCFVFYKILMSTKNGFKLFITVAVTHMNLTHGHTTVLCLYLSPTLVSESLPTITRKKKGQYIYIYHIVLYGIYYIVYMRRSYIKDRVFIIIIRS